MTKKSIKLLMVTLMLLVMCLYYVSGTYARYTTSLEGNATVTVAKWAVQLKNGAGTTLTENFELPLTVTTNADVVANKIAPACEATATINVDLTGTEVAVDILAEVDEEELATALGITQDQISVEVDVDGATDGYVPLVDGAAFTSSNGVKEVTITVTWENLGTDAADAEDTELGIAAGEIEIPVTLTVQQHIAADGTV